VIDFKTASPSGEKAEMYARQLQAYALALENPAPDALRLSQIEALGLLFFSPDKWEQNASQRQLLEESMEWMPIMRNDAAFMDFLESVVALLDGPLPDAEPDACDWCRYREQTRALPESATSFAQFWIRFLSGQVQAPPCHLTDESMTSASTSVSVLGVSER
jgi:PD-(D/E)XK nuclease superfamily